MLGYRGVHQWHQHLLAIGLTLTSVLWPASGTATESARLSLLLRHLNLIEGLAEDSARLPRDETSRYHFDYKRLRNDVQRIRQGVQDHLSPQRAQPRDPLPLQGDYRQDTEVAPMSLSADQASAFLAHGGFTHDASATLLLGMVFAVLLVWGVWALRTAYVGWAEHKLSQRQLLGVAVRFAVMYVVLPYFLLS